MLIGYGLVKGYGCVTHHNQNNVLYLVVKCCVLFDPTKNIDRLPAYI